MMLFSLFNLLIFLLKSPPQYVSRPWPYAMGERDRTAQLWWPPRIGPIAEAGRNVCRIHCSGYVDHAGSMFERK